MSARGRIMSPGTSLAVQWLKHHTCTAKGMCSSPGKGTEIPTCCLRQPKKGKDCKTQKNVSTDARVLILHP